MSIYRFTKVLTGGDIKRHFLGVYTGKSPRGVINLSTQLIDMGTSNLSAHRVLIEERGETKDVTAFCFSTPQAAETVSNLVPHWKGLAKDAVKHIVQYHSGCILAECPPKGNRRGIKNYYTPLSNTIHRRTTPPLPGISGRSRSSSG